MEDDWDVLLNIDDSSFLDDWGIGSIFFGSRVVGMVDVRSVRYYT